MTQPPGARALLCAALVLSGSCTSPIGPRGEPEFESMEIHYTRAGGWTATAQLDVFGDGRAVARLLDHATRDTLRQVSVRLDLGQRESLPPLFRSFDQYRPAYAPEQARTDTDHHTVVFLYDDQPDTVTVSDASRAALPHGLRVVLQRLDELWRDLLFPED